MIDNDITEKDGRLFDHAVQHVLTSQTPISGSIKTASETHCGLTTGNMSR